MRKRRGIEGTGHRESTVGRTLADPTQRSIEATKLPFSKPMRTHQRIAQHFWAISKIIDIFENIQKIACCPKMLG
jgi:hypothetical protein